MAFYAKYSLQFRDVNEKLYNVAIYKDTQLSPVLATIMLTPGDSPLVIDENDSKEFFKPIRTQTGNITICTKIDPQEANPQGGILDLADIMPSNNTDTPVMISKYNDESDEWGIVWIGYLSSEAYNQSYTDVPDNIQLPINSVLEAWKSIYYKGNAKVVTLGYLMAELALYTPLYSEILYPVWPQDCEDFWNILINTSIFVEKVEYIDEERYTYNVKGKSLHNIMETLCKFMGWTARENGVYIYLQKLQGYGLLTGTEQRKMSALSWRGNDHQRSIVAGAKSVKVTAKLDDMKIDLQLPGLPFGMLMASKDQPIGETGAPYKPWVYILPSVDDNAYSNIKFHSYAGKIKLGDQASDYVFQYNNDYRPNTVEVVETCIPYSDGWGQQSQAYAAYTHPDDLNALFAGAFIARIQIDPSDDHDLRHEDTKEGVFLSLFPAAWVDHQTYRDPIFEIRSVQAFAAIEEGWLNLDASFRTFWSKLEIDDIGDPCRFMFQLQVGDYYLYWDEGNSRWSWYEGPRFFYPPVTAAIGNQNKFTPNWSASMDIDEVSGLCFPTWFYEYGTGVKKYIMGEVVLRIFPETRLYDNSRYGLSWRNMVFEAFFERLDITYYPKKSAERTDRRENTYYRSLNTAFSDEKKVENDIASWLHNNPSPSLLYKVSEVEGSEVTEQMQKLTYLKSDGTTEERRPEKDLLNRMAEYYSKPRTILNLEVQHIDDKPLPLLRYVGLGDGKLYAPMSASRDFQLDKSTINFMELPELPAES